MKKLIIAVILFFAITFVSFGQYAFSETNGKDWNELNSDQRVALTFGFFMGVSFANVSILGYDADGIVYLGQKDYQEVIFYVNDFYGKEENLMTALADVYIKAFMKIILGI